MNKNIFLSFCFFLFLLLSSFSHAKFEGPRWSLGVSSQLGFGYTVKDDDPPPGGDVFNHTVFLGGNTHIAYRFSQKVSSRLTVGGQHFLKGVFSENDFKTLPDVHLSVLVHLKSESVYGPYLVFGLGLPTLLNTGLGIDFPIYQKNNKAVSLFLEAMAGSSLIINEVGVRLGVQYHF